MKWLHRLLKGASFSGALFVLQACYGTPEPDILFESGEAPMSFSLLSNRTGEPLEGIKVSARAGARYQDLYSREASTGADGTCRLNLPYVRNEAGPLIHFESPDGKYSPKDTTLDDLRDRVVVVRMAPVD